MESHSFTIEKNVRYVSIGEESNSVKDLWVCLHGYGQLAVWFARNFAQLEDEKRLIVVPEGPHRFYLKGTSGRVGASWMTKEDRLTDIEDQFHYLEKLLLELKQSMSSDVRVHVLGFSQGVATAMRWLDRTNLKIHSMVCWAGTFPPDIDYAMHSAQFESVNMCACFGDDDEYISMENAYRLIQQLTDQNIKIGAHFYKGGHSINKELLVELVKICEA